MTKFNIQFQLSLILEVLYGRRAESRRLVARKKGFSLLEDPIAVELAKLTECLVFESPKDQMEILA